MNYRSGKPGAVHTRKSTTTKPPKRWPNTTPDLPKVIALRQFFSIGAPPATAGSFFNGGTEVWARLCAVASTLTSRTRVNPLVDEI